MDQDAEARKLERELERAKRLAASATDQTTSHRLWTLVEELRLKLKRFLVATVSRTASLGAALQTIEITDPLEARRCRYAQYRGHKSRLLLNGIAVTGIVRAVMEDKSST